MGSKKLKAIAVRGTGKVTVADPERESTQLNAAIKTGGMKGLAWRPVSGGAAPALAPPARR